ncbi:hypothetical protein AB0883_21140 [Micromonospora sp. NPDC047812]|uniref:hypothetical protein n=1 Tax=Micromonospora sp. NPDC047812 TaxID=3155742 RepID=UPI003451EE7D
MWPAGRTAVAARPRPAGPPAGPGHGQPATVGLLFIDSFATFAFLCSCAAMGFAAGLPAWAALLMIVVSVCVRTVGDWVPSSP